MARVLRWIGWIAPTKPRRPRAEQESSCAWCPKFGRPRLRRGQYATHTICTACRADVERQIGEMRID